MNTKIRVAAVAAKAGLPGQLRQHRHLQRHDGLDGGIQTLVLQSRAHLLGVGALDY